MKVFLEIPWIFLSIISIFILVISNCNETVKEFAIIFYVICFISGNFYILKQNVLKLSISASVYIEFLLGLAFIGFLSYNIYLNQIYNCTVNFLLNLIFLGLACFRFAYYTCNEKVVYNIERRDYVVIV